MQVDYSSSILTDFVTDGQEIKVFILVEFREFFYFLPLLCLFSSYFLRSSLLTFFLPILSGKLKESSWT